MPRRIAQNTDTAEVRSIVNSSGTKSDKARRLAAIGIRTAEIARLLNMSEGHVGQAVRGRGSRAASTRTADEQLYQERMANLPPDTRAFMLELNDPRNNPRVQEILFLYRDASKSVKARELANIGISRADIARLLSMSPGHVEQAIRGRSARGTRRATSTSNNANPTATVPVNTPRTNQDNIAQIIAGSGTKSEKARQLAALNVPIAEIARLLSMSPGHAAQAVRGRGTRSTSRRAASTTNVNTNNTATPTPTPTPPQQPTQTNTGYERGRMAMVNLIVNSRRRYYTPTSRARYIYSYGLSAPEIAALLRISVDDVERAIAAQPPMRMRTREEIEREITGQVFRIYNGSASNQVKARRIAAFGLDTAEIARLLRMPVEEVERAINTRSTRGTRTTASTRTNTTVNNNSTTPTSAPVVSTPSVQVVREESSQDRRFTIELNQHSGFRRKFGVEIECFVRLENGRSEDYSKSKLIADINTASSANFKAHRDGSISNVPAGYYSVEVVSPVLLGLDGLRALKKACEVLDTKDARVNKSCGFHVHFDSQDFKIKDWKNIVGNYAILETDIDAFLAPSRRGDANTYTQSLKKYGDGFQTLLKALEASTLDELRTKTRIGSRYHKVNLYTYLKNHNTVEFRQHQGTVDFHKMAAWILFLDDLVKFSEYSVSTTGGDEALKRFVNPDVMSHIEFRRNVLRERQS